MNQFFKERVSSKTQFILSLWNWNEQIGLTDQMSKTISTGTRAFYRCYCRGLKFFFSFFHAIFTRSGRYRNRCDSVFKRFQLSRQQPSSVLLLVKDFGVLKNQSWRRSLRTSRKLRGSVAFLMPRLIRWKSCFSINWLSNKVKRTKSYFRWDLSSSELRTSAVPKQDEMAEMTCNLWVISSWFPDTLICAEIEGGEKDAWVGSDKEVPKLKKLPPLNWFSTGPFYNFWDF